MTRKSNLSLKGAFRLGDVDDAALDSLLSHLDTLKDNAPLVIAINSEGGEWQAGSAICGLIQALTRPTVGVVVGLAASSAYAIFQVCDKRLMLPNGFIMAHHGSSAIPEVDQRDFRARVKWDGDLEALYLQYSRLTGQERHYKKAHYINAQRAVVMGLADDIVTKLT